MRHVDLSPEQEQAADLLVAWARHQNGARRGRAGARGEPDDRVRALRGPGGSGKSIVAVEVARRLAHLGTRVSIVAPTGKAAYVLRGKGVPATTIHAGFYELISDDPERGPEFRLRPDVAGDPDVVICDEASMATTDHVEDLLSRVPRVLLVGDPGQLPPVSGEPVLEGALGVDLVTVHRQALDSGVVRFAHAIRRGASVADALREGAPDVVAGRPSHLPGVLLVARNDLRVRLNAGVRAQVHGGRAPAGPAVGDRLVCLSNHRRGRIEEDDGTIAAGRRAAAAEFYPWCNGTVGDVIRVGASPGFRGELDSIRRFVARCDDGREREGRAWLRQLDAPGLLPVEPHDRDRREARFALGWCLTTHKAQGSEWDEVAVMGDGFGTPDELRAWRYTAATRAAKKLWWAC